MSDWHRREVPHGLPGPGHQSFFSDNDDRMDEEMEYEISSHTANDSRVQTSHSQHMHGASATGLVFRRPSPIPGHQSATPTPNCRRRVDSLPSFRQTAISAFESERRVNGLPSFHQSPAGSFHSERVDRFSSSLQLPNLNQGFHPGGSGLEFSSVHRPSAQTFNGLPSAQPSPSQHFQSGRIPNGLLPVYESPTQTFHPDRANRPHSVRHSSAENFHSRTAVDSLPSAHQARAAARAFHIGSTLQGSTTGIVPTASYTAPINTFAHGPDNGHTFASPEGDDSIDHLIPADPDEEAQPQADTMAIPAGTPYAAIQFNQLAHHLVARIEAGEEHRSRMEDKLDKITEALDALENKGSTAQPAPQAHAAAGGNQNNETATLLKALNDRLDHIEQQLAATKDNHSVTPQYVVGRLSTLGSLVGPQHENGRGENNPMDDDNKVAGNFPAPAHKRRSLPHSNSRIVAADLNRAKRVRRNTAGGAERAVHSDPLPSPVPVLAADRTVSLLLRPRVLPQVAGSSSGSSTPANLNAPSLVDEDDEGVKWARDFLSFLKDMNCTSDADLLRLRRHIDSKLSFEFPLCTSTEMGGYVQYFLKVGGQLSTLIAADPKDRPAQPQQDEELVSKLNILEFALDDKRMATAKAMNPGHEHPYPKGSYLVPLGEVYAAHRSANKPQEVASTNFFVLMEVTSPRKSLWMVYRYEKPVQRKDGGSQWGSIVFLSHRDSVFKGSRRHFDTVCLLEDVKGWRSPAEDMIDMGRYAEALPGAGSNVLQPVFYTPVLAAVREAMEKGWTKEPEGNEEE